MCTRSTVVSRLLAIPVIGVLAVVGATAGSAATLTGDTVSVNLTSGSDHGTQAVLVGAGADGNYFNNQFFDLDAGSDGNLFTISSTNAFASIDGGGDTVTWTLTSLDFGVPLTGVSILSSIGNAFVFSLTANSVVFRWDDVAIPQGEYFRARFEFDVAPVPVPAALPLFLAGLGLFGLFGWFKSRAA